MLRWFRFALIVVALSAVSRAQEFSSKIPPDNWRPWKLSLAPLVASQTLDVASSWGLRELNPVLADSRGGFGMKGAAIKFGATGAIIAVEYWILRKKPGAARVLSKLNWSVSAVSTGFAAHNFAIR
jgi:hypothetical protein